MCVCVRVCVCAISVCVIHRTHRIFRLEVQLVCSSSPQTTNSEAHGPWPDSPTKSASLPRWDPRATAGDCSCRVACPWWHRTPLLKWKSGDLLAQFFGCSLYDALWRGNPMIDVGLGNGLVFFEENGPSKKIDFNLWLYDEIMLNPWVCCCKSRYSSPVS